MLLVGSTVCDWQVHRDFRTPSPGLWNCYVHYWLVNLEKGYWYGSSPGQLLCSLGNSSCGRCSETTDSQYPPVCLSMRPRLHSFHLKTGFWLRTWNLPSLHHPLGLGSGCVYALWIPMSWLLVCCPHAMPGVGSACDSAADFHISICTHKQSVAFSPPPPLARLLRRHHVYLWAGQFARWITHVSWLWATNSVPFHQWEGPSYLA